MDKEKIVIRVMIHKNINIYHFNQSILIQAYYLVLLNNAKKWRYNLSIIIDFNNKWNLRSYLAIIYIFDYIFVLSILFFAVKWTIKTSLLILLEPMWFNLHNVLNSHIFIKINLYILRSFINVIILALDNFFYHFLLLKISDKNVQFYKLYRACYYLHEINRRLKYIFTTR